ncbi:phenylalanyl-tRNA synthetase, beta subunit [Halobacteroides halobius DSM 5150]|uniref:Phenylalanine--tRNA ligase beta subunit n=1 Tax=Halobacteroides halobius (strain ATCC 35273 / DSM 5150 / MD-1) TaxID=748449 RepID=L0K9K3_HALHC|nr:phenylalanine--tRNA ligase subunit beta [Halobacteroides halobius]AGB41972.1 phenylalanyl-tRNA synthetase, beta subunit [Halobacteroides halobius DSM 5150]
MKVSYNWLQDYIDFDYSPEKLAKKLTMAGLEVEAIKYQGSAIEDIIVGEILEIKEHKNADKLSVCKVNVGDKNLQIVCGANNMKEGDKVPVAPVGTTMPEGMKIEEVKLRGVQSRGMMCSTNELDLPDDGVDGLFILEEDMSIGNKLTDELDLNDVIIEFDLTPNYSHCLSMIGVAREIAAITGNKLQYPKPKLEEIEEKIEDWINIRIEDEDLAPRYAGRIITDIKVKESPRWLKRKLEAVGIRPTNNVVDVTNFILMELGLPLHAFDYNQLAEQQIVIRRAKQDEKLVTLDDQERDLDPEMLVIADANKPVCIAGVMGGANSEVTEKTTTIFLEGANFSPSSIRKTSRKLGIHSDASHRFERGVDINLVELALNRAAELIAQLGNGKVIKGITDIYPKTVEKEKLLLDPQQVRKVLGLKIAKSNIKDLLERLHFSVEDQGVNLLVEVPTYRVDIKQEIDLIEEVARLYGYDKIEPVNPKAKVSQGKKTWAQKVEDKTRNIISALGLFEVQNYSFVNQDAFDQLGLAKDNVLRNVVKLNNPVSEEHTVMRTTLVPGLLNNVALNVSRKVDQVKIFELGKVFLPQDNKRLPNEKFKLSAAVLDESLEEKWELNAPGFFYLKGVLEDYFINLGIENLKLSADEVTYLHPGRTAEIKVANQRIGYIGEVHPDVQENYNLDTRVTIFELDFNAIVKLTDSQRAYSQLPKYPALKRDIALVVKEGITHQEIEDLIEQVGGAIIESVELFDLYQGEQIPNGYKSLAYSLSYRVTDRTLTDKEVNKVQEQIEEELDNKLEAKIRE